MKKQFLYSFLFAIPFLEVSYKSQAQIDIPTAHGYITNYQAQPGHYPGCFLVNADGLRSLLVPAPVDEVYLHIYLASWYENFIDPFLMFVRTKKIDATHYKHDLTKNYALISTKLDVGSCVIYDFGLDGNDEFHDNFCNINTCYTSTLDKDEASQYIYNYQTNRHQCPDAPIGTPPCVGDYENTQSFNFKADTFITYLNNFKIKYVQIYLAKKNDLSNADQLTLVIVGVDYNGNHIFYNSNQVFDECNPCPKCFVEKEIGFDYERQDLLDSNKELNFRSHNRHR